MGKPTGRDVRRGSGEVGYIDHRTSISRTEQCPCLTAVLELGSWLKIRILLRVTYLSPRYQLPAFSSNFVMNMLYCCLSVCHSFPLAVNVLIWSMNALFRARYLCHIRWQKLNSTKIFVWQDIVVCAIFWIVTHSLKLNFFVLFVVISMAVCVGIYVPLAVEDILCGRCYVAQRFRTGLRSHTHRTYSALVAPLCGLLQLNRNLRVAAWAFKEMIG